MVTSIDWRRRLTAPAIGGASWSSARPGRLAIVSTESGTSQAWAWDLDLDERRQASAEGVGAEEVHMTPDGDRRGLVARPAGRRTRALDGDAVRGWRSSALVPRRCRTCGCRGSPSRAIRSRPASPTTSRSSSSFATVRNRCASSIATPRPPALARTGPKGRAASRPTPRCSRSGTPSHRNIENPAIRVVDARSGATIGEVADADMAVVAAGWSPVPGDDRLVVLREIGGVARVRGSGHRDDGDPLADRASTSMAP